MSVNVAAVINGGHEIAKQHEGEEEHNAVNKWKHKHFSGIREPIKHRNGEARTKARFDGGWRAEKDGWIIICFDIFDARLQDKTTAYQDERLKRKEGVVRHASRSATLS